MEFVLIATKLFKGETNYILSEQTKLVKPLNLPFV